MKSNHPFVRYYREVESALLVHCEEHLQGNWCLSCCLWGRFRETATPTIIIFFYAKKESWISPNMQPLRYIQSNLHELSSFPTYENQIDASCAIGTRNTSGTLGGYIQCVDTKEVRAMTCAHVCGIEYGIISLDNDIYLEQPSSFAIDSILMDSNSSKSSVVEIKRIKSFDLKFARVCEFEFCNDICSWDWALLNVLNRSGVNIFSEDKYGRLRPGGVCTIQPMNDDDQVWKQGATTGFTTGTVHGIEAHVNIGNRISSEMVVIGSHFSAKGDSGSWVYKIGGVCGVVFGVNADKSWNFVTPFGDLLERINLKTGRKWSYFTNAQSL